VNRAVFHIWGLQDAETLVSKPDPIAIGYSEHEVQRSKAQSGTTNSQEPLHVHFPMEKYALTMPGMIPL